MKINKLILSFLLCFTSLSISIAQDVKKINIGDQVPDYEIKNLMNYPQKTAKMNDFRGKLLILDFWTFGCVTCVESWPKLMKLQDQFKDKIQIIIVNTDQTEDRIKEFIEKQEKINRYKMTLTGAYADKNLSTMFPHQGVPHVIFIDQKGIVTNITAGFTLHQETIKDMLAGKQVKTAEKTDNFSIAYHRPLFINGNYSKTDSGANVLGTSIIAPYTPDVLPVSTIGSNKTISVGAIANYSISGIFSILYGTGINPIDGVRSSRIVYKGVDSSKLVTRVNGILKTENLYCLQLIVKKQVSIPLMKQKMIRDFEFTIGYRAHWEKQTKICVVFSKTKDSIPTYQEGDRREAIWSHGINLNNLTMDEFLNRLTLNVPAFYSTPYPFVDETELKGKLGNIVIESPDKPLELKSLAKHLLKFGIKMSLMERDIDVLVITENKLETDTE